ncbi:uncharacterized protein [Hetaerina americana]|uniref:uncharacterized protein n=1 Tax=Hetaerina americana TaxID=62018 RepID=UPI003A7F357B
MPGCSAYGCSNRTEDGVCLKVFPRDPVRRAKWAAMVNRKNWTPKDTSYLCEEHFEENQWEVTRVDGKKKLKSNAIPTIFDVVVKRKAKNVAGKRSKQPRTDDESVIYCIDMLEQCKQAMNPTPECVVCSRPLDDKKEYLSTLTVTTGLSLYQYLNGISSNKSSKIKQCSSSDSVCYFCAHLINYADKIEAELTKLKHAFQGCLQIKSLRANEQAMLKPEFDSHVAILDEFGEKVLGPDSAASRDNVLSYSLDDGTVENPTEKVSPLETVDHGQVEEKATKNMWKNKIKGKIKGDKFQEPPAGAPPHKVELPVLKCKICQLQTTSRAILLFHLRRHMANYQTCDFCDIRLLDDEDEELELNKHRTV